MTIVLLHSTAFTYFLQLLHPKNNRINVSFRTAQRNEQGPDRRSEEGGHAVCSHAALKATTVGSEVIISQSQQFDKAIVRSLYRYVATILRVNS